MKNTLKISLKPGEKIYVNGAVIKVERKTTLEFLNDVQFLLESHVLQAEDATTPLRQLYFVAQIMLMNPSGANEARAMFRSSLTMLLANLDNSELSSGLKQVDRLVGESKIYEALCSIRALYRLEQAILNAARADNDDVEFARELAHAVGE